MGFTLSDLSLSFLTHVDPRLIAVARLAAQLSPGPWGVTAEQSRTPAEEAELVRTGRSHTLKSHHIVDYVAPGHWAAPGCSGAIDAVPIGPDGAFAWDWDLIYPMAAAWRAASEQLTTPITWGGVWDKLMSDYGASATEIAAEERAYTARQKAAGNHRVLLDGPHFELGGN